jgi:phosphatidylinositol glycan class P protein
LHASAEVYGFCLWCSTFVFGLLYLVWAFVPDSFLHDVLGVTYYPSKWWALALPAWGSMALAIVPLLDALVNAANTLPLDERNLVEDAFTRRQRTQRRSKRMQQQQLEQQQEQLQGAGSHNVASSSDHAAAADPLSIPDCADIPLSIVNELLYSRRAPKGALAP